jgi:hypothetical protein
MVKKSKTSGVNRVKAEPKLIIYHVERAIVKLGEARGLALHPDTVPDHQFGEILAGTLNEGNQHLLKALAEIERTYPIVRVPLSAQIPLLELEHLPDALREMNRKLAAVIEGDRKSLAAPTEGHMTCRIIQQTVYRAALRVGMRHHQQYPILPYTVDV